MKSAFFIRMGLFTAFGLAYPGESIFEWQFGVMAICLLALMAAAHFEGMCMGAARGVEHARKVLRDTLVEAKDKE